MAIARDARAVVADPSILFGGVGGPSAIESLYEGRVDRALPRNLALGVGIVTRAQIAAEVMASGALSRLTHAEVSRLSSPEAFRSHLEQLAGVIHTGRFQPQGIDAASKVDSDALGRAAWMMGRGAELAAPYFRRYAAELQAGALAPLNGCNRPGPIFCDPAKLIEVWGTDHDTYTENSPAIIRVDLGGNDTYLDQAGGAAGESCHVETVPCTDALAFSLNVDVSGNDTYLDHPNPDIDPNNLRQGGGFFGVGVLVDLAGNDAYTAEFGQGFAYEGAGLLLDAGGNDSYTSSYIAQGVGLLAGVGTLVDRAGSDSYYTVIGQGLGVELATGALIDVGGRDAYSALGIAQGAGIALGAGLIVDASGNDTYGPSVDPGVYLQGASTQSGAGALVDLSGNDRYSAIDLSEGSATDGGTAYNVLIGEPPFKQRVMDTFAVFLDVSGADEYSGPGLQTMGYANTFSLARFRDVGHGVDSYVSANPNPRNNAAWRQGGYVRLVNLGTKIPAGEGEDR